MKSCPECNSERTHLSRRMGLLEKTVLTLLFLKPFRCEKCDCRFFRLSFASRVDASRAAATH
jgi:hypothetical protein